MQIIKLSFIIPYLIVFQINIANTQCYTMLTDLSGMTSNANSLLEEASCALADSFPGGAFRDSFGVYDFGFYLQTENMGGQANIDAVFEEMVSRVSHPFYLIFGRKSDPNGIYTQLFVKFNFPVGIDKFDCLSEEDLANYKLFLPAFLINQYSILQNDANNANLAIKETINEFAKFVTEKKGCCVTGFTYSCNTCLDDDQLAITLTANKFERLKVDSWVCLKKDTCITYKIGLETYDLMAILEQQKIRIEKYFKPFIIFYDYKFINGTCFNNYPFIYNNDAENYFSWRIIIDEAKKEIWIKGQYGVFNRGGKSKIHYISEENSNLNFTLFKSKFNHFLSLMNCAGNAEIENAEAHCVLMNHIGPNDLFIIVGKAPFVKATLSQSFCEFAGTEFIDSVNSALGNRALELGDGMNHPNQTGRMAVIDYNSLTNSDFGCTSKEEVAAFVSIHAFGHCVAGAHKESYSPGAYLSNAERLRKFINSDGINECGRTDFIGVDDIFNTNKYKDCYRTKGKVEDGEWVKILNQSICQLLGL